MLGVPPALVGIFEQQSHHCGIERSAKVINPLPNKRQQSHHCGIEREGDVMETLELVPGSNRTIVGLKAD